MALSVKFLVVTGLKQHIKTCRPFSSQRAAASTLCVGAIRHIRFQEYPAIIQHHWES
jgi:hypothetical protein